MCIMLYWTGKVSINKISKIFNIYWSLVCKRIDDAAEKLQDYKIKEDIREIKFDEMCFSI